jgi:hypothetical protein
MRGGKLRASDLPDALRRTLIDRRNQLNAALIPADDSQIRAILATTTDMPAPAESDPNKLRFAVERDIVDLRGLPEWALVGAARAYRRGEISDGRWRPTAGQLAKLARERCTAALRERQQIQRVLSAPIEREPRLSPEQRRAFADKMRSLVAQPREAQTTASINGKAAEGMSNDHKGSGHAALSFSCGGSTAPLPRAHS